MSRRWCPAMHGRARHPSHCHRYSSRSPSCPLSVKSSYTHRRTAPTSGFGRILGGNGHTSSIEGINVDLHGGVVGHPGKTPNLALIRRKLDKGGENILLVE